MLLLPSIFNGLIGLTVISILAVSLFIFPLVFAEDQNTLQIIIPNGASQKDTMITVYPDKLPVSKGDYIQWVNHDSESHSITSGVEKFPQHYGYFFKTGLVNPGESATIKLASGESYAFYYLCEIHPWITGKLFYQEALEAKSETDNPIKVGKPNYLKEDAVQISGQVHKDFWGTQYEILIYDEKKNLIDIIKGKLDKDSKYSLLVDTSSESWNSSGKYELKIVYGLPSKVSQTDFNFSTKIAENKIPIWVKNVGEYWCTDKTTDLEFVNAIQYLASKKIINVKNLDAKSTNEKDVPSWIKTNTCWWSNNQIPDSDFLMGIEFLINQGTIQI